MLPKLIPFIALWRKMVQLKGCPAAWGASKNGGATEFAQKASVVIAV
jgi:hypothetical protein